MDVNLRNDLETMLESKTQKYGLEGFSYLSFVVNLGYRSNFCASDCVYVSSSLLETPNKEKTSTDAFLDAIDSLEL